MITNKSFLISLLLTTLLVVPFSSAASTAESIIGIGVLGFLTILALILISVGFYTLNNRSTWRLLSIGMVIIGFGFLYGATSMAQLFLESAVTTLGGTEVYGGIYLFVIRMVGWSYWGSLLLAAYYFVKIFNEIRKDATSRDGWDNNLY